MTPTSLKPIRRALLSVTDKSGLIDFARELAGHGVELVSTGGTARTLRDAGLSVRDISDLTGFPEMLDGRVKTLHPNVHGGILHVRSNPVHVAAVKAHAIQPIDMVVVNLYAFEATASRPGAAFSDIIENIDIGGPSMIRSAAKNFEDVAVVTTAADYAPLAHELSENVGCLSRETRWRLAQAAFSTTAAYDTAIAATLPNLSLNQSPSATPEATPAATPEATPAGTPAATPAATHFPPRLHLDYTLANPLRYGENPHQAAALYVDGSRTGIASAVQLQGKELSFNNLVDLDACWDLVGELAPADPDGSPSGTAAVAIIKHTNPCGAALGATVLDAYNRALAGDPVSAFGGVIGISREVDEQAAEEIARLFVEAIVAPSFTPGALARFASKKNLRLVRITTGTRPTALKQISGGLLLQEADLARATAADLQFVTDRQPTAAELDTLLFAWRVSKHVKSNAIVYARTDAGFPQTVGIGAGQMSRVDAARFGAMKAALPLAGSVAASDAFFPFADGLEVVADAGATAVIQPGGSVRDAEVIDAANRRSLAMAFTGVRHFRHG